jgi:very-short-patch-repair endonuclease
MIEKRSSDESRTWARRDRSIVPINKARGRAMRSAPTDAERKLWWHLRYRLATPSSHFRREVHLGHFIVDFACHAVKIIIEVDGGQHSEQGKHDVRRTQFLSRKATAYYGSGTTRC